MRFYTAELINENKVVMTAEVSFLGDYKGERANFVVLEKMLDKKEGKLSALDKTPKIMYSNKTLKEVLSIEFERFSDYENSEKYDKTKSLVIMEMEVYSKKGSIGLLGLNDSASKYTVSLNKPIIL